MKRKAEIVVSNGDKPKIPLLSPFIKEETPLNVDIERDVNNCVNIIDEMMQMVNQENNIKVESVCQKLLIMKQLNRRCQFQINLTREQTKQKRDEVNNNHLLMQNLLYEAVHLKDETSKCLEYKLVSDDLLDENLAKNTDELQNHQAVIDHLHWELNERKQLSEEISQANVLYKQLSDELTEKDKSLTNIVKNLDNIIQNCGALETIFGLPNLHLEKEEQELVGKLPSELYQMYIHARVVFENRFQGQIEVNSSTQLTLHLTNLSLNNYGENASVDIQMNYQPEVQGISIKMQLNTPQQSANDLYNCLLDHSSILHQLDSYFLHTQQRDITNIKLEHSNATRTPCISDHIISWSAGDLVAAIHKLQFIIQSRLDLIDTITQLSIISQQHWTISDDVKFHSIATNTAYNFVKTQLNPQQCFFLTKTFSRGPSPHSPKIQAWMVIPWGYPTEHSLVCLDSSTVPHQILQLMHTELNMCTDTNSSDHPANYIAAQMSHLSETLTVLIQSENATSIVDNKLLLAGKFPVNERPFQ